MGTETGIQGSCKPIEPKNHQRRSRRNEAAKYVLETINIAPVEEAGLWIAGPTTKESVIKEELRQLTL